MVNKWRMLDTNKNPESLSVFSGLNLDLEAYSKELDRRLVSVPWIKSISESLGCRPCYLMFGAVSMLALTVSMGYAGALICNLVGFIYPAYMSFKALETDGTSDDKQWLTYWVVYAIFNILEAFIDIILFWVPFYYLLKLFFLFWLFLPQTAGAVILYNNIFRRLLIRFEKKIDDTIENVLDVSNSAKLVAQRYSKKLLEGPKKSE
ncbi:TB2/DP1/HVA22-like integral membrane protein [Cryptosporidium canis]|uniref:TB2/DP1/HVA22-like integral membrane protein n=1 Tax=Cryptosporidium canis TaxID=195482 RepID=A0A9D5HXI7_9CRYT|nr:TB2/DP1/HVA22-like integral membrane protein [Cryptosporidium canis]